MDTLIRSSLRYKTWVIIGVLLFLVLGFMQSKKIPVDVLPDLNAPLVTVITEAHGLGPEDVEKLVTYPLESALQGTPGLRRIRSSSATGVSIVKADFTWDSDPWLARQVVMERLQTVREKLPKEVDPPVMTPPSSIMGEILFLGLSADHPDQLMKARTYADSELRYKLLAVPGVTQVTVIGSGHRVIQIQPIQARMSQFEVGLLDLQDSLEHIDGTASGGFHENGSQAFLVRSSARPQTLEQIAALPLNRKGVSVGDVAQVTYAESQPIGKGSVEGREAIILSVARQPGANTLEVTKNLDRLLNQVRSELPDGVELNTDLFRQSRFIVNAMQSLSKAFLEGGGLVVLIVVLFLASFKASLICLVALPLSLISAALLLKALGIGMNTMTLGGLTIAVGALVDDAIVFVENAVRNLNQKEGGSSSEAILESLHQIFGSILYATLIIVVVFFPLFFLSGVEGKLFEPLGLAYVLALGISLLVAVGILPAFLDWLRPGEKQQEGWFSSRLKGMYEPILNQVLKHSGLTLFLAVGTSLLALLWLFSFGTTFLPAFREGALTIQFSAIPGTSLTQADQMGRRAERAVMQLEGVEHVSRRVGRAAQDAHASDPGSTELEVVLDLSQTDQSTLVERIRHTLEEIGGLNFNVGQPISHRIDHVLSGARAAITVQIFGEDLLALQNQAQRVKSELEAVGGLVDLNVEQQSEQPEMQIHPRWDRMAEFGIEPQHLALKTEAMFAGAQVSEVLSSTLRIPVVIRQNGFEQARDEWRKSSLRTPHGEEIRLEEVAELRYSRAPNRIGRLNGSRRIFVTANLAGADLGGMASSVENRLQTLSWPQGMTYSIGGQFEAARSAARRMAVLSAVALILVVAILNMALGSLSLAFLTLATLPLSLIGGAVGVHYTSGILSLSSLVGFIALFGIATRNGILLLERYRQLREEGFELRLAVIQGSRERLIPILMTALSTSLGLVPLALNSDAPGNELQAPVAAVILGGVMSSTLLSLLVLPPLYEIWDSKLRSLASEPKRG